MFFRQFVITVIILWYQESPNDSTFDIYLLGICVITSVTFKNSVNTVKKMNKLYNQI